MSVHVRWIEIDHRALAHNIRALKKHLGSSRLWPVVKGRAYGHGAAEAARTFMRAGAAGLAVSALAEAVELRESGIDAPLFVMNPVVPWQVETYAALRLRAAVADLGAAEALSDAVSATASRSQAATVSSGQSDATTVVDGHEDGASIANGALAAAVAAGEPLPVHVKVDTGLGRFGLMPDQVVPFVEKLSRMPGLTVEGIFTHLASADDEDQSFARAQLRTFEDVLAALSEAGLRPPLAHAANSPATLVLPESHYDMVRNGLLVYGLYPSPWVRRVAQNSGVQLQPALSLKARAVSVRRVAADTPIGYGSTFRTHRETTIVTLPIGYSDGVSRLLSGKLEVLVHGQRCPVVGRICMNHCMVDAGDLPVRRGDVVTLLGRDDTGAAIPAEEWAEHLGTISYEVLCMVGSRNPHRHLYEGAAEPTSA